MEGIIYCVYMFACYLAWCAGYRSWRIPLVPFAVVNVISVVLTILWMNYLIGV